LPIFKAKEESDVTRGLTSLQRFSCIHILGSSTG